jgi:hypothetical protein
MTTLSDTNSAPVTRLQPAGVAGAQAVSDRKCPEATGRTKRISRRARREELAIANLMVFPTIDQAATATKVSEKTLRRWLAEPRFANRFRSAKRALLDRATDTLLRGADQCAVTLVKLANDKTIAAGARVRACTKTIELVVKAIQCSQIEERLTQLEAGLKRMEATRKAM